MLVVVMLSDAFFLVMLRVTILSAIILGVVMLSVVILSVVASDWGSIVC